MTNYMKKIIAGITGALLLVTPALAWDVKSMNKQVDATNVLVNDNCSGTFIGNGFVLTAAHCIIDHYKNVEKDVIDSDGKVKKEKFQIALPGMISQQFYTGPLVSQTNNYVYKIIKSDRSLDLGLLKIQNPPTGASEVACDDPTRGETVYAVGNSYGVLYSTITKGIVSSLNRSYRDLGLSGQLGDSTDTGEHGLVQHSAPIAGGNSGGALYNEDGKLIGVNVRGAQGGFSFSVPLSDVRDFLGSEIKVCDAPLAR